MDVSQYSSIDKKYIDIFRNLLLLLNIMIYMILTVGTSKSGADRLAVLMASSTAILLVFDKSFAYTVEKPFMFLVRRANCTP
jgi:hypothetical protein